jgi:hypothetical protein
VGVTVTPAQAIERLELELGPDVPELIEPLRKLQVEVARLRAELHSTRDDLTTAQGHAEWLQAMFVDPHAKERKIFWDRTFRVLGIVRDESGQVTDEEKLALIEAILTEYDRG